MPLFQHLAEHPVGVVPAFTGSLGVHIVHPGKDDDPAFLMKSEEQAVRLEELGTEPVLVLVTECTALPLHPEKRPVLDLIVRQVVELLEQQQLHHRQRENGGRPPLA